VVLIDAGRKSIQQRGTVGLVLRVIPTRIKSVDELGLPPILKRIAPR